MLEKTKRIRLHGKKLKELNDYIYERDGHCCAVCGAYVEPGTKFHHEPPGRYKSDEKEKGVLLCPHCHDRRHNGNESRTIQGLVVAYLQQLYGEKGAKKE